jgi:hypothetical protein
MLLYAQGVANFLEIRLGSQLAAPWNLNEDVGEGCVEK